MKLTEVTKLTTGVPGLDRLTQRLDGVSVRLWQPSEIEPRRFSLWLSEDAERIVRQAEASSILPHTAARP